MERSSQLFSFSLPIYLGLALGCAKGVDIGPGEIVILSEQPADAGRADAATEQGTVPRDSPPSEAATPDGAATANSSTSAPQMMAAAAAVLMPATSTPVDAPTPNTATSMENAPGAPTAPEADAGVDAASARSLTPPPLALDAGR